MDGLDENVATPSVLSYSDQIRVGVPAGDLQYITNLPNNGGTFGYSQSVNFSVNVPHGCFVDMKRAYIRYNIKNTSAVADSDYIMDRACGGVAVIDSMKWLGTTGGVISDIQNYNALVALLNDFTNGNTVQSTGNLTEGASSAPNGLVPIDAAGDLATAGLSRRTIAIGKEATISHVPKGGMWNADKLLPLGMLNGQVQLQIGLATQTAGGHTITAKTLEWETNSWELHLPIIKVSEEFQSNFRQLMASGVSMSIHTVDFSTNQATIASSAEGQQTVLFANRRRSAKSVFTIARKVSDLSDDKVESASARRSCGTQQYNYSISGIDMPSQPVKSSVNASSANYGEVICEMNRALGHLGSTFRGSVANATNFMPAADKTVAGLAVFSLDLEAYQGVLAGKNLSSSLPLIYRPTFSGTATENAAKEAAVQLSCYTAFDSMLVIDGVSGSLTAVN